MVHFTKRRFPPVNGVCIRWRCVVWTGDVLGPCLSLLGTLCLNAAPPLLLPRVSSSLLWYLADQSYKELLRQASKRKPQPTRMFIISQNKSTDSLRRKTRAWKGQSKNNFVISFTNPDLDYNPELQ